MPAAFTRRGTPAHDLCGCFAHRASPRCVAYPQVLLQKYGEHAARNVAALEEFGCCVKCSVDGTNLGS